MKLSLELQASLGNRSFARLALEEWSGERTSATRESEGEKVVIRCESLQVRPMKLYRRS